MIILRRMKLFYRRHWYLFFWYLYFFLVEKPSLHLCPRYHKHTFMENFDIHIFYIFSNFVSGGRTVPTSTVVNSIDEQLNQTKQWLKQRTLNLHWALTCFKSNPSGMNVHIKHILLQWSTFYILAVVSLETWKFATVKTPVKVKLDGAMMFFFLNMFL